VSENRLSVGDPAPDFTLSSDTGEEVSLQSLRGRKVIVYFYPAAMTSASLPTSRPSWPPSASGTG
jgi:thioredoxin-dependent peroxiredoxin